MSTFPVTKVIEVTDTKVPLTNYDVESLAEDYFEQYNGEGSYQAILASTAPEKRVPEHVCTSLVELLTIAEQKRALYPLSADDPRARTIGVSFSDGTSYSLPLLTFKNDIYKTEVAEILTRLGATRDDLITSLGRAFSFSGKRHLDVTNTETLPEVPEYNRNAYGADAYMQAVAQNIEVVPPNQKFPVEDLNIERPDSGIQFGGDMELPKTLNAQTLAEVFGKSPK